MVSAVAIEGTKSCNMDVEFKAKVNGLIESRCSVVAQKGRWSSECVDVVKERDGRRGRRLP